jgi:O-antigen ligase
MSRALGHTAGFSLRATAVSAPRAWPAALGIGLAAFVASAMFAGGGSTTDSLVWIGGGVAAIATAAGAVSFSGVTRLPRLGRLAAASLAFLVAFVAWNGISIVWSVQPDRSWDYFNRGLVYLGFLVAGLFVGALVPRALVRAAAVLTGLIAVTLAWALAGKFIPSLYDDGGRIARLRAPVEYWNALALLFAIGLPLALYLVGDTRRRPVLRATAVLFAYGLVVGLLLTYSRGGVAVSAVAVTVWLLAARNRVVSLVALVLAGAPAVAVAVWAFDEPGVSSDGAEYATRVRDGAQFAGVFALGGVLVLALAYALARLVRRRGGEPLSLGIRKRVFVAGAGVAAVVAAALVFLAADPAAWARAQADEFSNPPTLGLTQEPGRLASVSSNNRWIWWQEAWHAFRAEPVIGTGAGSFEVTHRLLRENPLYVLEPHNQALQFLSETGIVGFLLAGGAVAAAAAAAVRSLRRLDGREQAAGIALAVGVGAYVLHSLVDWDWDFVAVSAPVFAITGVLFSAGGRYGVPTRRRIRWLAACALLLLGVLASLVPPWLADRRVDGAYAELAAGDASRAAALADQATDLHPLAIEPWVARSDAAVALGEVRDARRALVRAVEVQPLNAEAWHALSVFEDSVAGRPDVALAYARRALELDRFGPAAALVPDLEARARQG